MKVKSIKKKHKNDLIAYTFVFIRMKKNCLPMHATMQSSNNIMSTDIKKQSFTSIERAMQWKTYKKKIR